MGVCRRTYRYKLLYKDIPANGESVARADTGVALHLRDNCRRSNMLRTWGWGVCSKRAFFYYIQTVHTRFYILSSPHRVQRLESVFVEIFKLMERPALDAVLRFRAVGDVQVAVNAIGEALYKEAKRRGIE